MAASYETSLARFLGLVWVALAGTVVYVLRRYANRDLFQWHVVSRRGRRPRRLLRHAGARNLAGAVHRAPCAASDGIVVFDLRVLSPHCLWRAW